MSGGLPALELGLSSSASAAADAAGQSGRDLVADILADLQVESGPVSSGTGPVVIGGGGDDGWIEQALASVSDGGGLVTPRSLGSGVGRPVSWLLPVALIGVAGLGLWWWNKRRSV
ncbi:hypothetical protein [Tateyamaria sp.]|uniref:hypothetical protein n=1 Tax=Tateyamaria sp. TaxID=1929288 RepID=UPI003B213279